MLASPEGGVYLTDSFFKSHPMKFPGLSFFAPRRIAVLPVVACLLLIFAQGLFAQGGLQLDPIVDPGERQEVQVHIDAEDDEVHALARRAVELHGGLRLVDAESARFVFNLSREAPAASGVSLEILASGSGDRLARNRADAGRVGDSVAGVLDFAVERILGLKGFFSGQLTFIKAEEDHSEVFYGDMLFQSVRQLTTHRSDSIFPHWRPDGGAIAYTSYFRSGFPDVFLANLASRSTTPVASFRGSNTGGVFSPDGQRLALVLTADGSPELFLAGPKGGEPRRLTTNNSLEASPTWAPDGQRLAFAGDPRGRPQIYVIATGGNSPRRLPTDISGYCAEPVWNPVNPNEIAFTANMGGTFQTAVYDLRRRESRLVSRGSRDVVEPAWLADGRHLVVTVRERQGRRLHVLDSLTGRLTPLHSRQLGETAQADYLAP
jgi:TolB protein